MNNETTKFRFSYMKNDRKRFITITYDKNRNVNIRFWDNEEDYDEETEDWN